MTCAICSSSGIWPEWPISTVNEDAKTGILKACVLFLRATLIPKVHLVVESLALRQQQAVLGPSVKRPKLRPRDRVFWVWLSRLWPNWQSVPILVQVRNGHQVASNGIQVVLAVEIQVRQSGRPRIEREIGDLIRRMPRENPTWGSPRILFELLLLGHDVSEATVDGMFTAYIES